MKTCTKCGEAKEESDFHSNGQGGRRPDCKPCVISKAKQYRADNPEVVRQTDRRRYYKAPELMAERARLYRKKNKEAVQARGRLRTKGSHFRALRIAKHRERCRVDPGYHMEMRCRIRILTALKRSGAYKSAKTITLIGCDVPFLKAYIEARFLPEMTWENRRLWHLDHRIPCAAFDLTDPDQQRQCFHYSNLQPLWKKDNMDKRDHMPGPHQAELI